MSTDDIITIDLSNADLGMYPCTSMSDSITISGIAGDSTYTTDSVTLSLDPSFQINLDDTTVGLGAWYEERRIIDEYNEEKALRDQNEGIQKAWEQYKILVELAKNPPECT